MQSLRENKKRKVTQPVLNKLYETDSRMGGAFTIRYKGIKDGRHQFKNTHKGWEGHDYSLTDEQLENGEVWEWVVE